MKADLHNHTTHSDGNFNVKQLIEYASTKELDLIAITDHDSVGSYDEIQNLKGDLKVITGIELSTDSNNEDVHILGYFYNNEAPTDAVKLYLKDMKEKRKTRVIEIISKLKEHFDIEITYEDVIKLADGTVGRPHIAWAIEQKYGTSFTETFEKYIGNDQKAYVPTAKFTTKEVIDFMKKNNVMTVIAHPKLLKKNDVESIIKLGVDGIEVIYPLHTKEDEQEYRDLAKKYNLIITGGSDFHKLNNSSEIGTSVLKKEELNVFLKKLNYKI